MSKELVDSPDDLLGMSDEEFMEINSPEDVVQEAEETPKQSEELDIQEEEHVEEPSEELDEQETIEESEDTPKTYFPSGSEEAVEEEVSKEEEEESSVSEPNYKEFYEQVMAPMKANGKTIELQNPQEAIQLMQMGANYTKKMQAIQPYRKILLMLENNDLLDEGKLSFLIDIDKKNPEAINKLIVDAGIDPFDIDTDNEPTYQAGNHRVTDEEAAFVSVMDDLKSTQDGTNTLLVINSQWDQASKEVLWTHPDLMNTIHQQRTLGIYDQIVNEIERRRVLGDIPTQVPFIQVYKAIGDEMDAQGAFRGLAPSNQPNQPQPVAKRVQKPKGLMNSDKVSAAASTRNTPKKTERFINPLAMDDDEFLKQMANRL